MDTRKKSPWWVLIVAALLMVVVAYTLSIGPVWWLWKYDWTSDHSMEWIKPTYRPLEWACDRVGAGPLLDWYLQLWLGPGMPADPAAAAAFGF